MTNAVMMLSPADLERIPVDLRDRVSNMAVQLQQLLLEGWLPIDQAPKDATPVDLWIPDRYISRVTNMRRVDLGKGNVFYEPNESGPSCVRDATHFRLIVGPVGAEG